MNRRDFFKTAGVAAGAATLAGATVAKAQDKPQKHNFKLKYAPHFGMFENHAGKDFVDQINFMADVGFRAMEDNGMKGRSMADQEKIASAMSKRGVEMGVFVANTINWKEPTLTTGKPDILDSFVKDIKDSVEVAKRVNAKWMTVVPGFVDMRQHPDYQRANVIEALKRGAEIFEPHGMVMVLEPLNFYNHPGLFLTTVPQAYEVCKAVDSPACKILDDLYHVQIQEGNLIPNIDKAWDEIAYFQVGDNPGRKEPTTGEIHYQNVFKHIAQKSTDLIIGMEHGKSMKGKDGEIKLIEAYAWADDF